MIVNTGNEWESSDKAGLVSIGSHALFVSTNGPVRRAAAPVTIFITGGGAPTEMYMHLHSALSQFTRNYFYDRTGYGRSERPHAHRHIDQVTGESSQSKGPVKHHTRRGKKSRAPQSSAKSFSSVFGGQSTEPHSRKVLAEDTAIELRKLMAAIRVKPPYVLAAHSYGGIIARTYFALFPDDVAGIALLDTNSELLQQCLSPIPAKAFLEVTEPMDEIDFFHLRERSGMTDEEWDALLAAVQRTVPAAADEATHASGRQLARFMQVDRCAMATRPLLVAQSDMIKDWRKLLDEALRLGYGTREQQEQAKWWMESVELFWQQAYEVQAKLSMDFDWVLVSGEGHYFPMTLPGGTAYMLKRLLDKAEKWALHFRKDQSSASK